MKILPANFLDHEQGSEAWFEARCGMVGSSRVAEAIARLKRKSKNGEPGEPAAARINLRLEIIGEILTGKAAEHYVSRWMEEGKENEPLARAAYEMENDTDVQQVGFVLHPRISRGGASPDGLVGDEGLIEIKCPKIETHLQYMIDGVVPDEYQPQMLWQMACAERQWCDFASYNPQLPEDLQLFVIRFQRDDRRIAEMEAEVNLFFAEVDEMLAVIKSRLGGEPATEFKLRQSIALVQSRKQFNQEIADAVVL